MELSQQFWQAAVQIVSKLSDLPFLSLEDLYYKRIERKHTIITQLHSYKEEEKKITRTYNYRNVHWIDDIINWKKIHLICLVKIDTHSCNINHLVNIENIY